MTAFLILVPMVCCCPGCCNRSKEARVSGGACVVSVMRFQTSDMCHWLCIACSDMSLGCIRSVMIEVL